MSAIVAPFADGYDAVRAEAVKLLPHHLEFTSSYLPLVRSTAEEAYELAAAPRAPTLWNGARDCY
jgi:hypothetical protein